MDGRERGSVGTVGLPDLAGEQSAEGIGTLIGGVIADLQDIVRAEFRLAQTELVESAAGAGRAIVWLIGGALVGVIGFIFLMLAAVLILDEWIREPWLSATIVAVGLLLLAGTLVVVGRNRLRAVNFAPEQTMATLKENQAWVKQQISSVQKSI